MVSVAGGPKLRHGWHVQTDAHGNAYYWNSRTYKSTWTMPPELKQQWEEGRECEQEWQQVATQWQQPQQEEQDGQQQQQQQEQQQQQQQQPEPPPPQVQNQQQDAVQANVAHQDAHHQQRVREEQEEAERAELRRQRDQEAKRQLEREQRMQQLQAEQQKQQKQQQQQQQQRQQQQQQQQQGTQPPATPRPASTPRYDDVAAAAAATQQAATADLNWEVHADENGHAYFYNTQTEESTWDMPPALQREWMQWQQARRTSVQQQHQHQHQHHQEGSQERPGSASMRRDSINITDEQMAEMERVINEVKASLACLCSGTATRTTRTHARTLGNAAWI